MGNNRSRQVVAKDMKEMLTDAYLRPIRQEIEESVRGFGLIDAIINDDRCPASGVLFHESHNCPDAMRFYVSAMGWGSSLSGTMLPGRGGLYEDFGSEDDLENIFISTYIDHCLGASIEALRGRAEDMIDLWAENEEDALGEEEIKEVLEGIVDDLTYLQFNDAALIIMLIDNNDEIVMVSKDGQIVWDMEDDADMPIPLS